MNFLYKLERKWGKYAIPNLMRYILFGQSIVYMIGLLSNINLSRLFGFNRALIMEGQIWRLVTFVFVPDQSSPLWFILFVIVYMSIANALENAWGSFNFNIYYILSSIATLIVAWIFNIGGPIAMYINLSLFLSFASLAPDTTFMLYFFIPIKAKYLSIFYFIIIGSTALQNLMVGNFGVFTLILASFTGYVLYFVFPFFKYRRLRGKAKSGQKAFKSHQREMKSESSEPIKIAFHKCSVCGITEVDDPDMEFRYCSKCNGSHEYCMNHLKQHSHID
ncbi:MAG: hypothetical protein ACRCSG_08770 [Cellulosilyticaceae bacterium]